MTVFEYFKSFFDAQAKRFERNGKISNFSDRDFKTRRFYSLYAVRAVVFSLYVARVVKADYLTDKSKIVLITKKLNEIL